MPTDPRLAAIPAVRALAERQAREHHDAQVRAIKASHSGSYAQDLIDALPPMWVDVAATLALLSDPSRPESRDALARLVTEAVGWSHADTWRLLIEGEPCPMGMPHDLRVAVYRANPDDRVAMLALHVLGAPNA